MTPDAQRVIIDELAAVAAFLVEPGRHVADGASSALPPLQTNRGLMASADLLAQLTPSLLRELGEDAAATESLPELTRSPIRALPGRKASEWECQGETWVPRVWWSRDAIGHPPLGPLQWLLSVVTDIAARLDERHARVRGQLSLVLGSTRVDSRFAREDEEAINQLLRRLDAQSKRLKGVASRVRTHQGLAVRPRPGLPTPFPRQPSWLYLRRLTQFWTDPEKSIGRALRELLDMPVDVAELPFLYERWCVTQVVAALEKLPGVRRVSGDVVMATFVGGEIRFEGRGAKISLWVEPRIGRHGHSCGMRTESAHEQTPDIVLIRSVGGARDAWIIDATLSTTTDAVRSKGRYLNSLVFDRARFAGGIPIRHRPQRAWAMCPRTDAACELFDVSGQCGAIPLHPLRKRHAVLDAWLAEFLDEYAIAAAPQGVQEAPAIDDVAGQSSSRRTSARSDAGQQFPRNADGTLDEVRRITGAAPAAIKRAAAAAIGRTPAWDAELRPTELIAVTDQYHRAQRLGGQSPSPLKAGETSLWVISSNLGVKRRAIETVARRALGYVPVWDAALSEDESHALRAVLSDGAAARVEPVP